MRSLQLLLAGLAGLAVAVATGGTYTDRLSDHRGFFQVAVKDRVVAPAPRPRHAALVVLDGLGAQAAARMGVMQELAGRGQCRLTYVGPLSVSRPLYSVLSTGLEQDRTGSRNNACAAPLGAESVWQVAREAGLEVSGVSELPWFRELFPTGFSSYQVRARGEDFFQLARPADLMLIHPLYIDEAGHEHGAASAAYGAAVDRADRELRGLLSRLDLRRDLLVVTADHGHSARGGHGGQQREVVEVLTCYAGRGVLPRSARGAQRAISIGPSLALLLSLRFPAHMRAGDDDLEVLWELADPAAFPPGYLEGRRTAVERYRAENRAALAGWLGPGLPATWPALYQREGGRQRLGLLLCAAAVLSTLLLMRLGGRGRAGVPFTLAWVLAICVVTYVFQIAFRGSFDPTSINQKGPFVRFTAALVLSVGVGAGLLHYGLRRDVKMLLTDASALIAAATAACLGHPAVFGWTLRPPLPSPALFFFPYFAAIFLAVMSILGIAFSITLFARNFFWRPAQSGDSFQSASSFG